jgi:hypothetical protein
MHNVNKLVAIDIGNSHTSIQTINGIEEFASLVIPKTKTGDPSQEQDTFKTSFGTFLIGSQFIEDGVKTRSIDSTFYSSETFRVIFLYALSRAGIQNPVLITGLPTEFYESQRNQLADNLRAWAKAEKYNIEGIIILRQQSGAFYDPLLLDEEGKTIDPSILVTKKIGVIDIGYGTIDCGELVNGKPASKNFGESQGISQIHKQILTNLQSPPDSWLPKGRKPGLIPDGFSLPNSTNEHTIDKWLKEGARIPFRGSYIDLNPLTKEIRENYANNTIQRCINQMWGNVDFHDGMIVTGGGATVIGRDILKTVISCKIYIPESPNLSIVRGFYTYALLKIQKSNRMAK